MGKYSCKVCADKIASRVALEEKHKGMSPAGIARLLTLRGFSITAPTLRDHFKHAHDEDPDPMGHPPNDPPQPPPSLPAGRDFSIMVRDKAVELMANDKFDLLDKDHAPGIMVGLRAQAEINKMATRTDDRKTALTLAMILSGATGGGPPSDLLLDDGMTIEGEAVDVTDG